MSNRPEEYARVFADFWNKFPKVKASFLTLLFNLLYISDFPGDVDKLLFIYVVLYMMTLRSTWNVIEPLVFGNSLSRHLNLFLTFEK